MQSLSSRCDKKLILSFTKGSGNSRLDLKVVVGWRKIDSNRLLSLSRRWWKVHAKVLRDVKAGMSRDAQVRNHSIRSI